MTLNVKQIDKLIRTGSDGRRTKSVTPDGGGLYLKVISAGASWLARFTLSGKRRWIGLGDLDTVTLAEARDKALEVRRLVASGIDPIEHRSARRRATAGGMTFRTAVDRYIAIHGAEWKDTKVTTRKWRQIMTDHVFPTIGDMAVTAIKPVDVVAMLAPIWIAKTPTAERARLWIHMAIDGTRGVDGGLDDNARNPAEWDRIKGSLANPSKIHQTEHYAALPFSEAPEFMARLRAIHGVTARMVEYAALTGVRSKPVFLAQWGQIDLSGRIWTIPGPNEKSGHEHRVPLSSRAIEILFQLRPINVEPDDYVFHGVKGRKHRRGPTCMERFMQKVTGNTATVHGFRSTFRDWAGEMTSYPADICEAALSHKFSGVRGAYQRGDLLWKRRDMMQDWCDYCQRSPVTMPLTA